jgi:hypothetical protein
VPAGEIEGAVIDQLRAVFRQPEIVVGTWRAAREEDAGITEAEVRDALLAGPALGRALPDRAGPHRPAASRARGDRRGWLDIQFRSDGLAGLVREFGIDAKAAA